MAPVCRWLIWVHKTPAVLLPLLLEGKECWWLCSLWDAASQSICGSGEKVSVGCPTEVTALGTQESKEENPSTNPFGTTGISPLRGVQQPHKGCLLRGEKGEVLSDLALFAGDFQKSFPPIQGQFLLPKDRLLPQHRCQCDTPWRVLPLLGHCSHTVPTPRVTMPKGSPTEDGCKDA